MRFAFSHGVSTKSMKSTAKAQIKILEKSNAAARGQIQYIRKYEWGFFRRRCAILNLEGMIKLHDAWIENLKMGLQV